MYATEKVAMSLHHLTQKINRRLEKAWTKHRASAQLTILTFIDEHMEQMIDAFRSNLESVSILVCETEPLSLLLAHGFQRMTNELRKVQQQLHEVIKQGELHWEGETDKKFFLRVKFAIPPPPPTCATNMIGSGTIVYHGNGSGSILC